MIVELLESIKVTFLKLFEKMEYIETIIVIVSGLIVIFEYFGIKYFRKIRNTLIEKIKFKIDSHKAFEVKNGDKKQNQILIQLENKSNHNFTWKEAIFREKDNSKIELETKRGSKEIEEGENLFLFEDIQSLDLQPKKEYEFIIKFEAFGYSYKYTYIYELKNFGGRFEISPTGKFKIQ